LTHFLSLRKVKLSATIRAFARIVDIFSRQVSWLDFTPHSLPSQYIKVYQWLLKEAVSLTVAGAAAEFNRFPY
jgi:hypothetical protein